MVDVATGKLRSRLAGESLRVRLRLVAGRQVASRPRPPRAPGRTTTGSRGSTWFRPRSGRDARSIWKPPLQIACPRWSPDGREIAVIHGIMSDEGIDGRRHLDRAGRRRRREEPHARDEGVARPRSSGATPDEILFTEYVEGDEGVAIARRRAERSRRCGAGPRPSGTSRSRGAGTGVGRDTLDLPRAATRSSPGPIGAWKPVTKRQRGDPAAVGRARRASRWESDGATVQGWL